MPSDTLIQAPSRARVGRRSRNDGKMRRPLRSLGALAVTLFLVQYSYRPG